MCIYHSTPYEYSSIEEELTMVPAWSPELERMAATTLLNCKWLLFGFVDLVMLIMLYGCAQQAANH